MEWTWPKQRVAWQQIGWWLLCQCFGECQRSIAVRIAGSKGWKHGSEFTNISSHTPRFVFEYGISSWKPSQGQLKTQVWRGSIALSGSKLPPQVVRIGISKAVPIPESWKIFRIFFHILADAYSASYCCGFLWYAYWGQWYLPHQSVWMFEYGKAVVHEHRCIC